MKLPFGIDRRAVSSSELNADTAQCRLVPFTQADLGILAPYAVLFALAVVTLVTTLLQKQDRRTQTKGGGPADIPKHLGLS